MWERLVRKLSSVRLQPDRETIMEKDVVCGMQVDPAKAAATSEYKGKTYYFCAKVCKTKFDANPTQYVKQ
jgi:Cu+-exporting ATPase